MSREHYHLEQPVSLANWEIGFQAHDLEQQLLNSVLVYFKSPCSRRSANDIPLLPDPLTTLRRAT